MLPPISADEAALLRAVCLDPWDDLPRLVIADWYEERGQGERAELIRAAFAAYREPSARPRVTTRTIPTRALTPELGSTDAPFALRASCRGWWTSAIFRTWSACDDAAAAGLWSRAPLVRAGCRGVYPARERGGGGWVRGSRQSRGVLPARVFDALAGLPSPAPAFYDGDGAFYNSPAEAVEALSRAMVDEGRSAAGLPPLAWPAFADPPG